MVPSVTLKIVWPSIWLILRVLSTEYECTWTHGNAHFDLCAWQKTSKSQGEGYWEVYDDRDTVFNNYTYHFNICGDVINTNSLNSLCTNQTLRKTQRFPAGYCTDIINGTHCKCLNTSDDGSICYQESITPINISTAAYQMPRKKSEKDCYRLHDGVTPPIFSLIDETDPTEGVRITYTGGDWCPAFGKNREFIINFICKDNYENVPDKDEKISEPSDEGTTGGCTYILEIDSTIGCPTQCNVIRKSDGTDALCAGNGICEYDETNNIPKCFCYEGWYGESCELNYESPIHIQLKHNDAKYIVLLIIISGFMTILSLIIIYLSVRIYISRTKTIEDDMAANVSINNATTQQNKQLQLSTLAEPLAQDEDATHPVVV